MKMRDDRRADRDAEVGETDEAIDINDSARARQTIPVVEEQAQVGKRTVEKGALRVVKTVEERDEVIDLPQFDEHYEVTRVPMNKTLDGPPSIREEGDMIIIPVVEEQAVLVKRLVLTEEIHLKRRVTESHFDQPVRLRREKVDVERVTRE